MRVERASRADRALSSARLIAPKHAGAYRAGRRRASILWSIERQSDGRDVFVFEVQRPALTPRDKPAKDDGARKIGISLSEEQYQKLSIAALKKGKSRNQLLTAALNRYVQLTIER